LDVAGVVGVVVHRGDLGGAEPVTVTVGFACLFVLLFFLKGGVTVHYNFVLESCFERMTTGAWW
jgi:hypothetical protein